MTVWELVVAPAMLVQVMPSLESCHWNELAPLNTALNVTDAPEQAVFDDVSVVIDGAELTVTLFVCVAVHVPDVRMT